MSILVDVKRYLFIAFIIIAQKVSAQIAFVDPFIGTGKSNVLTRWGSEGGTYPGAVAPSGFIQLSPETRGSGYDYSDSTITYFSCMGHHSGFPTGSKGLLFIMPVNNGQLSPRPFSHKNEKASPGYYSVRFSDDSTLVEATATTRAGIFRFTFPANSPPQLFVSDSIHLYTALCYSLPVQTKQRLGNGYLLTFVPNTKNLEVSISASGVSTKSAQKNIDAELSTGFDIVKKQTTQSWQKLLSVIEISDTSTNNKKIFYTALYHSLLLPWVVSDVDGNYRGADNKVHQVKERVEYGGFSPWDTFRSLHPLLSLLFPDKQSEMVLSMLDVFKQTGHLPIESMTGNHAIPIIVDSYLKGVPGIDSSLAYKAMKKSINEAPYLQHDMEIYHQLGYIPFTYPESVTRTLEYAYDDWALSVFADKVMHNKADHELFSKRGHNYRNLFHPQEMCFVPRNGETYKLEPGNAGYKEGDKWIYSYFVPQHPEELINRMGGEAAFTDRLEKELSTNKIVFDNETLFHVPYLFNIAGDYPATQKWVSSIMRTRFSATPGGLPGNDDLGSVSSWYILSAMGIFPIAPGTPEYSTGVPFYDSIKVHLPKGKELLITKRKSPHNHPSVSINEHYYSNASIPHAALVDGGTLTFETSTQKRSDMTSVGPLPPFSITDIAVSKATVVPDEPFYIKFSFKAHEDHLTVPLTIVTDNEIIAAKNILSTRDGIITDSILCRLYNPGVTPLHMGRRYINVNVVPPTQPYPVKPVISAVSFQPVIQSDKVLKVSFTARNTGGITKTFRIPTAGKSIDLTLAPGEKKDTSVSFKAKGNDWKSFKLGDSSYQYKVYNTALSSLLLDSIPNPYKAFGKDHYIELPNAPIFDIMDNTITMMMWVYPTTRDAGLTDIFTKGDAHVIQTENNKTLTFFAGGWGRGDVTVPLPDNWVKNWHHVAGVCYGDSLKLYVDGVLKGTAKLEENVNLSNNNKWTFGRNEEFPSQRIFNGYIEKVRIFAAPLEEKDIKVIMQQARPLSKLLKEKMIM